MKTDQIICGDNVETLSSFPADCIDLTVTSPPYGLLRTYDSDDVEQLWDFEGVAQQLWRVTKPGGVVVWVVADQTIDGSESGESFRQALRFKEIGFRLHDTMIWNKGGFSAVGSVKCRYGPVSEWMFVLSKGKPSTFNPLCDRPNKHPGADPRSSVKTSDGSMYRTGHETQKQGEFGIRFNVWEIQPCRTSEERRRHDAPFPEALARDHILSWSSENDVVLDPFAGSFTTCRMAKDQGRRWIGIEINPEYCEIGRKRMAQQVLDFTDDLTPRSDTE